VIDRRQFVTVAGSLIAASVAGSLARIAAAAQADSAGMPAARLNALFDVFMDERLTRRPQLLTSLGLDTGKYAWARAKLGDASLAGVREDKGQSAAQLRSLEAFDRNSVTGADRANYDTVMFQLATAERYAPFAYGEGVRPYVVSQLTGHYQSVPTFSTASTASRTRTTPRPISRASRPSRSCSTRRPSAYATTRGSR